jgi:hypothetical protein
LFQAATGSAADEAYDRPVPNPRAPARGVPDPARAPELQPGVQEEVKRSPGELTGIGASIAVDRFVAAAKSVQKGWSALTPKQRADMLGDAANAELDIVGVPIVTPSLENLGKRIGEFHFRTWTLGLGQGPFSAATLTDADAADVAATVYHEARHAEQWHRMARMLVGQRVPPDEIVKRTEIPATVVQDAKEHPLTSTTSIEAKEAAAWFDSVYGGKARQRMELLKIKEPRLRQAYDAAVAENQRVSADPLATPADKTAAARKVQEAAHTYRTEVLDKYHALAEEADTDAVEAKLKAAYLKK